MSEGPSVTSARELAARLLDELLTWMIKPQLVPLPGTAVATDGPPDG